MLIFAEYWGPYMSQDAQPKPAWRDGTVPISIQFDDPYFSLDDGLSETRYVFLSGNDLPGRFCDGFHIAELGFGTGLNLLAAWQAWRASGGSGVLHYTGFEAFPLAPDDLTRALRAFPEIADLADGLIQSYATGETTFHADDLRATLIIGDARKTVPAWQGQADAWFLDGFSPAKNPELWEPELLQAVADHTRPGGTAATYSAAGAIRRALADAGFAVERRTGFGHKRHMTVARLI